MSYRFDIGQLRPSKLMSDGRLVADGRITRTGVFVYRDSDGTERREYRPASEVHHADSIGSFAMVPVTDNHPDRMLDASNARSHAVGAVGESVRAEQQYVVAPMVIFDADTIAKMQGGKVQLSCGYTADMDETPGVSPQGERYDAIQTNIRGNHVAIVDSGRAGPDVRVRMDADADVAVMVADSRQDGAKDTSMDELKKAYADIAAANAHADAAEKSATEYEQLATTEKSRADKAEAERDSEKVRADKADTERKDTTDGIGAMVKTRVALETAAAKVLGADVKIDELSDKDIKLQTIKKIDGIDVPADKSADYVDARYDSAIDRAGKSDSALAESRKAAVNGATTDAGDPEDAARVAMMKRHADAANPAAN